MATDHSFDIASKLDPNEITNAIYQTDKELSHRFDLKDANANFEFNEKDAKLIIQAQEEYQIVSIIDIFKTKLIKRNLSPKAFTFGDIQTALGGSAKMEAQIQQGIPQDKCKQIVKDIKAEKFKVQAQIQGDQVRITSKKIDDLQKVIQFLKDKEYGIHIDFSNYR